MAIGAAAMPYKAVTPNHVHQHDGPGEKLWLQVTDGIFQLVASHLTVFMANAGLYVTFAKGSSSTQQEVKVVLKWSV